MSAGRDRAEARHIATYNLRTRIFDKSGGICTHCGRKLYRAGNYTVEHIIPLSKGGRTEDRNLTALCYACNKEKMDDIVEPEYYKYMPKDQKEEIKKLYEDYNSRFDWLSTKNLFQADRFSLKSRMVIEKPVYTRGQRFIEHYIAPTTVKVYKIPLPKIMGFMDAYRAKLSEPDRDILLETSEEVDTPYYFLDIRNKTAFMFSAYIQEDKDRKFMVYIDLFASPALEYKEHVTAPTLGMNIMAIIEQIQHTLAKGCVGTLIRCIVRTPSSDEIGAKTITSMVGNVKNACAKVMCTPIGADGKPVSEGRAVGCLMTLFQGSESDLRKAMKEHGASSREELGKTLLSSEQKLDRRIRENKALKPYHRAPKPTSEG